MARRGSPPACPNWEKQKVGPTLGRISEPGWPAPLRAPPNVPFCVVLLALIGRPGDHGLVFRLRFLAVSRSAAASPVLCVLVPSFSFGLCLCICFCLDQEPASCIAPPVCCSLDFDLLLLPACFCSTPPPAPPPSFEIPTRHPDPSRRVAARDSLETTRPPPDSRFQTSKFITPRWVNHG